MTFKHKAKAEPSKPVHVYVCTPAYDGKVDSDYAQSLAETAFTCPMFDIQITAGVVGNVGFIELARNIFVKKFLEDEANKTCTHLFFIDADIKFPWQAFVGLLKADLPVCAGLYRRRQEPEDYPVKHAEHPNGGGLWFIDDWLQCDRVPTGFLCIRRDVLEDMVKGERMVDIAGQPGGVPWVFSLNFEEGTHAEGLTRLIGEDYTFCDKYTKKYGKKIPAWTNLDFSHHGFVGNFSKYLEREADKAERGEPSALGLPRKNVEASSAA